MGVKTLNSAKQMSLGSYTNLPLVSSPPVEDVIDIFVAYKMFGA